MLADGMSLPRPSRDSWVDRADRLLVRERVQFVSAAMLVLMGGLWLSSILRGTPGHDVFGRVLMPDLLAHLAGGRLVLTGHATQLYDIGSQRQAADALLIDRDLHLFLSPPFVAWLYAPLAAIPYRAAAVVWAFVLALQLVLSARALGPWLTSWSAADKRLAMLAVLASAPALDLFGSGQDTGISLLLWVVGASLMARGRDRVAGLVLAFGWFKPQLFAIVPFMLIARRRWRALGAYGVVSLGVATATVALAGTQGVAQWRDLLASNAYHDWIVGVIGWKMQSIAALARVIVPTQLATCARAVGTLVGIGFAVWVCVQAWRSNRSNETEEEFEWWAAACLAALVASPHLFLYDLVLAAFPCVVALRRNDAKARVIIAALLLISWTTGVRGLAFGATRWPLRVLSGGWSAVPLAALLAWLVRDLRDRTRVRS